MKKKTNQVILIIIIILLVLFIIGYIFVPFAGNSVLGKIYSPLCGIKKLYQGQEYLPAWCLSDTEPKENENTNINKPVNKNINQPTEDNDDKMGIANPASVKCKEDGGTLEIIKGNDGEWGVCTFSDGSICEEWAYYRGDCQIGDCVKECQKQGTSQEGWYDSCTNNLIKLEKCDEEDSQSDDEELEDEPAVPANKSIKLETPQSGDQLSSPFEVKGQSIVKDDTVYVRVKSKEGSTLIEEDVKAVNQPGTEWADFSINIEYEFSRTTEGYVEVYSLDDNDNKVNLISIPVKF